jgi:hypothetical protein
LILEEAKVLHGPHSQFWREEEIVKLDWLMPRYSLCVIFDQIRIRFLHGLVKILSVMVAAHWLAVAGKLLHPTLCSSQNVGVPSFYTLTRTMGITCIICSSLCRVLSSIFKLWHQRCFPLNDLFASFVSFEYLWIYVLILCPYFWRKTSDSLKAVLAIRAVWVHMCLFSCN